MNFTINDLFNLLSIPFDNSLEVLDVEFHNGIKTIHVGRKLSIIKCPNDECNCHRLHSKGIYVRTIHHPVFQDTTKIEIKVHQRRWFCPQCNYQENETFPFFQKSKRYSNVTPFMIIESMKDLTRSTSSIASQFHISDTQVHDLFTSFVDMPRLPLTEYISIDEVFLNISGKEKYAFVIMDFVSGEIIDILHNRWTDTIIDYFYTIPREERERVKVVISDAYQPYLLLTNHILPNAISIVDSFHVVKALTSSINAYINQIYKKYRAINEKALQEKNENRNLDQYSIKDSKEMILLRDYRWVLLKNHDAINFSLKKHYHPKLRMHLDTYQIKKMFLELDKHFTRILELKEKYILFNSKQYKDSKEVSIALNRLIDEFHKSEIKIFRDFSRFLSRHKDKIIPSFTTIAVTRKTAAENEEYYARLSNGPMESFNRKPKDLKRTSRGFSNFDYTRNRILWSTRKNAKPRIVPKPKEEVHSYIGKKRGNYKKK